MRLHTISQWSEWPEFKESKLFTKNPNDDLCTDEHSTIFNPKKAGEGQFDPPSFVILKNVPSKERAKHWAFCTFNIILRHIFPENIIEFSQVAQKIWRNSLTIPIANFH